MLLKKKKKNKSVYDDSSNPKFNRDIVMLNVIAGLCFILAMLGFYEIVQTLDINWVLP